MKKFTYLSILLFTLTMVSCSDTNVLVPSVTSPDQNWQLTHNYSNTGERINSVLDPNSLPEQTISYTIDDTKKELVLTHKFPAIAKAEFGYPSVILTNNGTNIEIIYTQYTENSSLNVFSPYEYKIYLNYTQKGKGSGKDIKVVVKHVYTNPSIARNNIFPYTLIF